MLSDIKLFRVTNEVEELQGKSVTIEKSLQVLFEKHLEKLLGVRFLKSEYSTGKTHAGRIDTLGIDENNCPVIIEYKRALNENVINQGLFYLDWLMDHKAEFKLLVLEQFDAELANQIEWATPRLICIAGDFTKYDVHAVQQINRNISLIRYKKYGDDLLLLELVNETTVQQYDVSTNADPQISKAKSNYKSALEFLHQSDVSVRDRFEMIKAFLLALGDDVQYSELHYYFAFKRLRNFACLQVQPQTKKIIMWLRLDPDTVQIEKGFSRDVRNIGHHGTGDLEVTIGSDEDFEKAKSLIMLSYDRS